MGYVGVRYPTNVVYCIMKKRVILYLQRLWCTIMDGLDGWIRWMDGWCTTRLKARGTPVLCVYGWMRY